MNIPPKHLQKPKPLRAMQRALGLPQTGDWDDATAAAYRARMDSVTGRAYQADERLAALPFDGRTVKDCACVVTATYNLLHEMGDPLPFETVYAWHCAHADPRFAGTIGWRARRFFTQNTPRLKVRPAHTRKRLGRALQQTGYALVCFAYGLKGAHYVAVKQTDSGVLVLDYVPCKDGSFAINERTYPDITAFLQSRKHQWLLWAYCLGPRKVRSAPFSRKT